MHAREPWMRTNGEPGAILRLWPKLMAAVGHVEKSRQSEEVPYKFRSIDDVLLKLQPALIEHGVTVTLSTSDHEHSYRATARGVTIGTARVHVLLRFIAPDGTWLELETDGQGVDTSDKATGKAITSAVKYSLLYGLMVPTGDPNLDPDASRPELDDEPGQDRPIGADAAAVIARLEAAASPGDVRAVMDDPIYRAIPACDAQQVQKVAVSRFKSFNAGEKRYHLRRCRGSTWQSGMEQGKPYGGVAEAGMVARSGRAGAAGSAAGYARAARRRWDGARADRAAAWGQGAENDAAAGMGPAAARERGQQRLRRGRYRGLARTSGPGRGGRGCRG